MSFSWESFIIEAQKIKLQRAKNFARGNVNPDFDIKHPNEIREYAKTGTYTELTKRVKDELTRQQNQAIERRRKLAGN